jgi:hypothetical protein
MIDRLPAQFLCRHLLGEPDAVALKAYLYDTFPVAEQGDDFVIFDLRPPAQAPP